MGTQPQYWIIMEYNISWEYIHYTVMVLFPLQVSWYINMFLECIMAIVCNEQFSSNKMATCRMIWWKNIPWQTPAGWMRDLTNHGSIRMSSILRIWHNGNMMGFIRRIFMGYHQTHREIFGGIFLMWMSTQIQYVWICPFLWLFRFMLLGDFCSHLYYLQLCFFKSRSSGFSGFVWN